MDDHIIQLVASMEDAYAYVETIHGMDSLTKPMENWIEVTLRQTMECASFIRQYCGESFVGAFCARLCSIWQTLTAVLCRKALWRNLWRQIDLKDH